ncbi:reprolysin-like metallopeptidase [Lysobacter humi (ex Lee et al. 2017)]
MRAALAQAIAAHRFANAPDRGGLMTYPAQRVVRHDGAYTWHRTDLSEAHARAAVGGELTVPLPSGEQLRFRFSREAAHASGDWTWVGSLNGDPSQRAIITFGEKAAFGLIDRPGEEPLRLTIRDGRTWLVETDRRRLAGIVNAATRPSGRDFLVPPRLAGTAAASQPMLASAAVGAAPATAANTVDVVVGYTTGLASALGGDSQAVTRMNLLAEVTNEAYANSQIDARVRIVHTVKVSYTDANKNDTALQELTGHTGSSQTTPNAAFSALRAARDQYGADLVSLVRKFNDPENDGCGVAWINGGGNQGKITSGSAFFGYSVVSDGEDKGTDGNTYFCRQETFAHELGHNMGAQHDLATADDNNNGTLETDEMGVFPYATGYKTGAANGNFYTIMAYGDSGQSRYRVFSNPRITLCGGRACGVENQADNARALSQTIPQVAAFRAMVVPLPNSTRPARGDANADGRSDVLWHGIDAQGFQPWLMNGAAWSYGPVSAISNVYRVGATGDFNGDGRADILWHDTGRTQLWAWIATANGTYSVIYLRDYPAGWHPVATADANADGRSDIYWHSPSAQGMQVWLMNGANWTYGPVHRITSEYRVVSIGDYNADGYADVLWRDMAETTLWQWQASPSGGYGVIYMRDYPRGWTVVGTGDLNADGREDVLWHNVGPNGGSVQGWNMQGASWTYGGVNSISQIYQPVATGDFNGDGRMDVLWVGDNQVWTWTANANGSFAPTYLRGQPSGWQVRNQSMPNYGF